MPMPNLDRHTAEGFDRIWRLYGEDGATAEAANRDEAFSRYFSIFPTERLAGAEGFDLGCGNGRIARSVAPRVGLLHCIDPSSAGLNAARAATRGLGNVRFHHAPVDAIPLDDASQDFGYSIGVLHHILDPEAGLRACVRKLKPGSPFLLYLYYSLDNRPGWFRLAWRVSDVARRNISKWPFRLRSAASTFLAATLYWPLSRTARLMEALHLPIGNVPLSYYRHSGWLTLRADALDRFGTAVEHRFSRTEIERMMARAGLRDIQFADGSPYWIAVGTKG
jgi:SAM-dependent methyltransferase